MIVLIPFIVGVTIGIIIAVTLPVTNYSLLADNMYHFIRTERALPQASMDLFLSSTIKYGRLVIILWVLAFIPIGNAASVFLLLLKSLSFSFSIAFLLRCYGWRGGAFALFSFFPQNAMMMLVYSLLTVVGISFAKLYKTTAISKKHFKQYLCVLGFSIVVAVFAAFLESFFLWDIALSMNI